MIRNIRSPLKYILVAAVLLCGTGSALADEARVSISGGFDEIEAFDDNDVTYISLSELADVLGGSLDWDVIGYKVKYVQDGFRFDFVLQSPFFILNDTTYNLTYQTVYRKGKLFVPAMTFIPFLDRVTGQKITWDKGSHTVRVESEYFNVTDLAFEPKANGLLIEIFLSTALNYDLFVTEGNWVNISIRNGQINVPRLVSKRDSRFAYQVKCHQMQNTGQVSIRLKRDAKNIHHKLVFDPPRIQISITDSDFDIDTAAPKPAIGPDNKIDVIVIDPGHGGDDYGAIGKGGTKEKDIVLKIAKELASLIRKDKKFKVVMTRDRDTYISLDKRAEIANNAGADLFVSIHVNASPKRSVRGWNVFFLAQAKNDSARAAAQLENSYFLREISVPEQAENDIQDELYHDPIVGILNEMIMTEFQAESHDFAMLVNREFRRKLKIPARGVDQAGFFVLNRVFTPSVLIEAAFISNPTEEKLLNKKSYQKDVAEGIYDAIKRFKAEYESD
jgi:N-acetylmuramoyl-L-alanine amidase